MAAVELLVDVELDEVDEPPEESVFGVADEVSDDDVDEPPPFAAPSRLSVR